MSQEQVALRMDMSVARRPADRERGRVHPGCGAGRWPDAEFSPGSARSSAVRTSTLPAETEGAAASEVRS
jgi:hypothetical protein